MKRLLPRAVNLKKKIIFVPAALLAVFILAFLIISFYIASEIEKPFSNNAQTIDFSVQPGWGVKKIASELKNQEIISSSFLFKFFIWQKNWEEKLQAGEYEFSPSLSIAQIAQKMRNGEVVDDSVLITIAPGQKIETIENLFNRAGFESKIDLTDFSISDFSKQFEFLNDAPAQNNLEGFLYPETLKFFKDATSQEIIEKILSVFEKNIDQDLRQAAKVKEMDFYEVLTMASIVEKEIPSSRPRDQRIAAGVFWKRLKSNYPLESCVTIEYILGVHKDQYTIADTRVDSPYNTYINAGLPPTPITSPRRGSIEAVVFFEPTDYNFFLADPQTGNTIFSKTLQEHNANKAKYLN